VINPAQITAMGEPDEVDVRNPQALGLRAGYVAVLALTHFFEVDESFVAHASNLTHIERFKVPNPPCFEVQPWPTTGRWLSRGPGACWFEVCGFADRGPLSVRQQTCCCHCVWSYRQRFRYQRPTASHHRAVPLCSCDHFNSRAAYSP
jgi:hypothetical protein